MKKVILASGSPRRRELLSKLGIEFDVVPSNFEEQLDLSRPVTEVATELAKGKAIDVFRQHPDAIVIGADTIVSIDGKQLGKPRDVDEARQMLESLRGRTNEVVTAIVVVSADKTIEKVDTAQITLANFSDEMMEDYIATGEPMDKAGAYGVQSLPPAMIERVDGDRETIMGLSTMIMHEILDDFDVW